MKGAIKGHDMAVLRHLRQNARQSLAGISVKAKMPASTVFKSVRRLEKSVIKKYTEALDYNRLGYSIRVMVALRADDRAGLAELLKSEPAVNTVQKVSGEYEFLAEAIFGNMLEFNDFMEKLAACAGLRKEVYYLIDEMKKEAFDRFEPQK